MNALRNQKGLTLVELMAALAIGVVLLGIAAAVLSSTLHLFSSQTQRFADQSTMKRTMNTLASELSNATQVVYFPDRGELRFHTGLQYKAVVFDADAERLTIYRFSESGGAAGRFADGGIRPEEDAELYTDGKLLAENVAEAAFAYRLPGGDAAVIPGTPLSNGQVLSFSVSFYVEEITIDGSSVRQARTETRTVKLLMEL